MDDTARAGIDLIRTARATRRFTDDPVTDDELWTALASAVLLALFAVAMTISFGVKEPLDYSVFSASAAALLLAFYAGESAYSSRGRDVAVP